jgi:DNA-3-methyladenine glycosylase
VTGDGAPPGPRRRAAPASRAHGSAEAGAAPGSAAARTGPAAPFPPAFYDRDPRRVARELLGAVLECRTADGVASGRVVETEAYLGPHDPACHAVAGRTRRTWHLHGPPGAAYVYRIYGLHWCLNAVTLPEGVGSAVLVRALAPAGGLALMRARRGHPRHDRDLANGPGKLCAALGVTGALDGAPLDGTPRGGGALVLRPGAAYADADVAVTPRIGITRAAEWPLRYLVRGDPHVSRTPAAFHPRPYAPGADDVPA